MSANSVDTLTVALGERAYPIHIGAGLFADDRLLRPHLGSGRILIVSDEHVAPHYLRPLLGALSAYSPASLVLPAGEKHKNLATAQRIFDALVENGCGRDARLVALGGGVIGDMTGFAAACYQRGIDWLQIPTTLLAQVDASVGGKTGVNHPAGKNLIGAFHQPRAVLADTATLATLAAREYRAGLAEVVKYGLIQDLEFLDWLEANMAALLRREPDALHRAIRRSCEIKAEIVAQDEKEHGRRALLNLGHTFGHAIEAVAGFGAWLHGEAVAAGTVLAAELSCRMGMLTREETGRVLALFTAAGLPVAPPAKCAGRLREAMQLDKKARAGRLRLVLLDGLGQARLREDFAEEDLSAVLRDACG